MIPDSDSQNRRYNNRFDKIFSVYISGAWGSGFGIARNISEGGMFIETLDPYPLGSQMQVIFSFPNQDIEMTATAEVVHICFLNRFSQQANSMVKTGIGVSFIGFSAEEHLTPSLVANICYQ